MKRPAHANFADALRLARHARRLTQEDFKSRVYISALERGEKQPTIGKVDELAEVLSLHPLTLLALAYCERASVSSLDRLLKQVGAEAREVLDGGQENGG